MSMMLSAGDIQFMKNSVRDIIDQWHTTITIMQPLPIDKQPNYDKLLHEFTGEVKYDIITIPAERKDIVNNYTNDLPPDDTEHGEKNAGTILYAIPNVLPVYDEDGIKIGVKQFKPHKESVIAIDDTEDRYHISAMRDRIGETLIVIKRYVGDIPDGSDIIDDISALVGEGSLGDAIVGESKIPVDGLAESTIGGDSND